MTQNIQGLGSKIKIAIKKSGKSRKEIAGEIGISEANIYKLYNATNTKVLTLIKLAKVTELSLNYFLDIEESEQVKELREELEQEKIKNSILEGLVKTQHYFALQLFEMLAIIENMTDSKEKLTLMTPDDIKEITFSRFLKLIYKFSTLVLEKPDEEEGIFKIINILFNIVELRQLILDPPDDSFMFPREITEYLPNRSLISNKVDEYIDFRKVWK